MPENGLPLPPHHGDHPYQVGSILPDRSLIAVIEVGLVRPVVAEFQPFREPVHGCAQISQSDASSLLLPLGHREF